MRRGNPIGMFGGCHRSNGLLGTVIMVLSTPFWRWFNPLDVASHSSVGFIYEDGYREIFEAREGKSWQGPISVEKVEAWAARGKGRRFTMHDIPDYYFTKSAIRKKRDMCMRKRGCWEYSVAQMFRMTAKKFLFIPIRHTPNRVVCSEAATMILAPQLPICLAAGRRKPDMVTPYDFEQAMKALTFIAEYSASVSSEEYSS